MDSPVASSSRVIPQPFPSSSSRKREEDLVYLFEAEEERITNSLSRKLERLKEEKVELENILEAENESHVNRLSREISSLRAAVAQQQQGGGAHLNGGANTHSNVNANGSGSGNRNGISFAIPPQAVMLEAMTRENEALRNRLADTERSYVELSMLNDVYRRELIELRRRLGLPIDNLIGLSASSPVDGHSQPTHLRSSISSVRRASSLERSPNFTTHVLSTTSQRPQLGGLPIPISMTRIPSSQTHRAPKPISSSTTPNTTSPSPTSSLSPALPFSFSPVVPTPSMRINGHVGATTSSSSSSSYQPNSGGLSLSNPNEHESSSYLTEMTTPPSSTSPILQLDPSTSTFVAVNQLSYPSVPPPSLSSSLGSPVYSRRNSFGQAHSRRMSGSGVRVAETGSLIRGRRMSSVAGGVLSAETVPESEPESPELEPLSDPLTASSPSSVVALGDLDLGG
ncbi:hypothetical protein FRB96_008007 [Tulasnella sp. 330]|nr:hypothetical protein FRB96_008007 [Tulasnella sp. 330]KAG8876136.1 hypothetical protein FRB98_007448 [Tulasnella sp. 332]KAG8881296.1 hypothetical protein FRB97_009709 [Tulasnella sp. 331]